MKDFLQNPVVEVERVWAGLTYVEHTGVVESEVSSIRSIDNHLEGYRSG